MKSGLSSTPGTWSNSIPIELEVDEIPFVMTSSPLQKTRKKRMKIILRLQSRDKAAMLLQKTIQFFFFTEFAWKEKFLTRRGKRFWFCPSAWPPWLQLFPSCPNPLLQSEANCEAIDMKMIIHSHLHKKGLHLASFWKWGFLKLGNGLLYWVLPLIRNYIVVNRVFKFLLFCLFYDGRHVAWIVSIIKIFVRYLHPSSAEQFVILA